MVAKGSSTSICLLTLMLLEKDAHVGVGKEIEMETEKVCEVVGEEGAKATLSLMSPTVSGAGFVLGEEICCEKKTRIDLDGGEARGCRLCVD